MAVVVVAGILFLVMIAGLALVAVAVRHEDRATSLCVDAPGALARRTRRITGFGPGTSTRLFSGL